MFRQTVFGVHIYPTKILPRGERYEPGTPVKVVADMSEICYAVSAGSRIRINVTSSDFPQYHVHSNQPGDWALAKENLIAHQTILTGKDYLSRVKIPCSIFPQSFMLQ